MQSNIIDKFKEICEKNPKQIAVAYKQKKITYEELDILSNQLGIYLTEQYNNKSGNILPIVMDRSVEMIIAIFGILKSGAAYLPIDSKSSVNRNKAIIKECGAKFILTGNSFSGVESTVSLEEMVTTQHILTIENALNDFSADDIPVSFPSIIENQLAYVLYTSGSTGKPKGAMVSHQSVTHLADSLNNEIYSKYKIKQNLALIAPFVFDVSVQQIFGALLNGHSLYIAPEEVRLDASLLYNFYKKNKIDISDGTPTHLKMLTHSSSTLLNKIAVKHFLIGGESLIPEVLENFFERFSESSPQITNVYGVTECCVDSIGYLVDINEVRILGFVPVGLPLGMTTILLLNCENGKYSSKDEEGEICIKGPGVGLGYLNRNDLTEKVFIDDPSGSGQTIYRTGDMARILPDGKIQFLGRADRQVNLRGFRIELGEIESAAMKFQISDNNNLKEDSQRCGNCILDEKHTGVKILDGICNVCHDFELYKTYSSDFFDNIEAFSKLMNKANNSKSDYDCLLLYSGGKDSSYVLYRLVQMGYKVLSFTFDNGYISEGALDNIKRVTDALGVEQITIQLDKFDKVFKESLKAESTVCEGCFRGLTALSTRLAIDNNINAIITGLSRGQIFDTKLISLYKAGIFDPEEINERLLAHRKIYHNRKDIISELLNISFEDQELDNINFVDFFRYENVSNEKILSYLERKKSLGWEAPKDTGMCSTNCKINDVGVYVHQLEKGCHNYSSPLSWDIRLGVISREEALFSIDEELDMENISKILSNLDYTPKPVNSKGIKDVAVILRSDRPEPYLCGYYEANEEIDQVEFLKHFEKELPGYMIPGHFIHLDKMPLTQNGKTDYQKLPAPDFSQKKDSSLNSNENISNTEFKLLDLWKELLEHSDFRIYCNFFDVGGDSFTATVLVSQIENIFDVKLSITTIIQNPTIHEIAAYLNNNDLDNHDHGQLLLIRPGSSENLNLVFIHDVWGGGDSYLNLGSSINKEYNIWVLSASNDTYLDESISIQELAGIYVSEIKNKIQFSELSLGGWSLGGILAFEIALQLEQENLHVDSLTILDSPYPDLHYWKKIYTETIKSYQKLCYEVTKENQNKCNIENISCNFSLNNILSLLRKSSCDVNQLKENAPGEILNALPDDLNISKEAFLSNLEKVIPQLKRLSEYVPDTQLNSPFIIYKALYSHVSNRSLWSNLSNGMSHVHELLYDHKSIMSEEASHLISQTLNQFITEFQYDAV